MSNSDKYARAGVNLDSAIQAKERIAELARATFTPSVASDIGAFGGVFRFPAGSGSLLVASADGVGTKIKIASAMRIYDTVGQDLVNHCVNDELALGASPLFFLDYIGHSDLSVETIAELVEGLSLACRRNGLALIGGETAQMPGIYTHGDFDLVGFIVGEVAENKLIEGKKVAPGNCIIALASNGLMTNGYSLARNVLLDSGAFSLGSKPDELLGRSVGEALMAVHPSFLEPIMSAISAGVEFSGLAHITGGGIPGNLVRTLPEGRLARLDVRKIPVPPIFDLIRKTGHISDEEMFEVFNMGAGFMAIMPEEQLESALVIFEASGIPAVVCGNIEDGERRIVLGGIDEK